jgi:hypothetical protein
MKEAEASVDLDHDPNCQTICLASWLIRVFLNEDLSVKRLECSVDDNGPRIWGHVHDEDWLTRRIFVQAEYVEDALEQAFERGIGKGEKERDLGKGK